MAEVNDEISELLAAARRGLELGNTDLVHLANKVGIATYVRIADEIAGLIQTGMVLDWGCGYGHMTYLLRNRGLQVVAYEIKRRRNIEKLPIFSSLEIIYGEEDEPLPFKDESFAAVLSCGVLEHVTDMAGSLSEIGRVLQSQGHFFIYYLPNRYSFMEWLAEKWGISDHSVKFDARQIRSLLGGQDFNVVKISRANMIPRNLAGSLSRLNVVYDKLWRVLMAFDHALGAIPALNFFSATLEVTALKL